MTAKKANVQLAECRAQRVRDMKNYTAICTVNAQERRELRDGLRAALELIDFLDRMPTQPRPRLTKLGQMRRLDALRTLAEAKP